MLPNLPTTLSGDILESGVELLIEFAFGPVGTGAMIQDINQTLITVAAQPGCAHPSGARMQLGGFYGAAEGAPASRLGPGKH
jgi:hypothetical protein